jgi:O-6-methylguanine DNA methyltransferase
MKASERISLGQTRPLVRELRELRRAKAPHSILPVVMRRVGLGQNYFHLDSPIGPVFIAYNNTGISAVMRARNANAFERSFRSKYARPVYPLDEPPKGLRRNLTAQLSGPGKKRMKFDLKSLSEFERAVLLKALEIPRGEVRPYSWIAREIGRPKAFRAVGTALGKNPIPLFIPCHRVVRSDGRIGDYAFGKEAKQAILTAEGVDTQELERKALAGERFYGSDTTRIFCFPTCRQAGRISDLHRVSFPTEKEAFKAGYRPCKICRPVAAA